MRRVKAIIERASDGSYSIYMDADNMDYLITGLGSTAEEALEDFKKTYEEMKSFYIKKGKVFEECEFVFSYDMASFLSYFSRNFSLAGLSRLTGINQGQLSHYLTGHRKPSRRTVEKMQQSIREFADELGKIQLI